MASLQAYDLRLDEAEITTAVQRLTALPETATAITALSTRTTDSNYQVRHNALVLLDRLAPQDPQAEHLLRNRLDNDDDGEVFRVAAQALLRRYPAAPAILDIIADRTQQHLGTRLGAAGAELLTQHRPTDPRIDTYNAYRPSVTRAAISIHNHGLDELPELTRPLRY